MGKWVNDRLDQLAKIHNGTDYKQNPKGVSIPIYGTGGIMGFTSVPLNSGPAILTGRKGTIDRPMYVKGDFWHVDTVFCIKANDKIDAKYLFYSFTNRDLSRLNEATGVPSVTSTSLYHQEFQYPVSLAEQRHIAEILTTCDEVIEKSEAVVEKYRAIKAGMLKDLFTRGIGKNGKLRPPPESSPQLYKDTALGKVPREWEVKSFDSAFELHGNNTLSRAFLTNQNGAVHNVHYGDVLVKYDAILDCDDEALPSVIAEGVRQAGNDYLQNGDLVFADTAEDDTVGKAVELYNVGDRKIVSGLHTIFARPKEDDFASRWLGYYVNSDSFHKQLLPFVVGSKVSSISRTNIKRTFVVIPESNEQQRIAERLSAIDAKIADELAVVAKYRKVKTGLMARLLTPPDGEVE